MPITGGAPQECFDEFREHVAKLVQKIVPTRCPIRFTDQRARQRRTLSFVNAADDDAIPIDTTHGKVFLYVAQSLTVAEDEDSPANARFRLRTVQYWYKLFGSSPRVAKEAMARWEYAAVTPPSDSHCRHHIQFGRHESRAIEVPFGTGKLDLNRVHLPTGWVLIEEVFRFTIHELGMCPPCESEWPHVLQESETWEPFRDGPTVQGGLLGAPSGWSDHSRWAPGRLITVV
jgi:hypothetical protein